MKYLLLLTGLLFFSVATYSQVHKGDRLFGGSFSLSFFNINGSGPGYNNNGNVGLMPSFGWGIGENMVLGIKGIISYTRSGSVQSIPDENTSSTLGVGPGIFLKKYKTLKDRFGVYFSHELNAYYAVQWQKSDLFTDSPASEAWGGNYAFNPGVFYKFSDRFLGEANVGGLSVNYYRNETTHIFGIGASFLQYFNLGINYIIGKKK